VTDRPGIAPRRDRRIVCFDCDSTLTAIEGIDWLAERAGAGPEVEALTRRAMDGEVPLEAVYAERLAAVRPGPDDLAALAEAYAAHVVEDARDSLAALAAAGIEPWVVSGGLLPAVLPFAAWLGIEPGRVLAVPIRWSEADPWRAAAAHPLASTRGKRGVVARLALGARVALVGDGASDAAARAEVDLLIGFGGVVRHGRMREAADAWIDSPSLSPVVPFLVGRHPGPLAGTIHEAVWHTGTALIEAGQASLLSSAGAAYVRDVADRPRPARLFLPGPTEVREEVLASQAQRLIGHRSSEIESLLASIQRRLREVFRTQHRVYVSTSSATGLFEAAARNCVARRALCCVNGAFSQRWQEVVAAVGKPHDVLEVEWGRPVTPELVEQAIEAGEYDAVTIVHNETSTAVTSPIAEIAAAVRSRAPDALLLVDTVSSLGGIDVRVDEWGLDVCLTGGQKCLALPPGLAFAAVSDRALERAKGVPDRGWYFDFLVFEKYLQRRQTPTTPAITLLYALDAQLDRILEEGLDARFARHSAMARHVRKWALERLDLFAADGYRSDSVSAVTNTRQIDIPAMNRWLAENHDMVVANGYGKLADRTFRIGHMGDHTVEEMETLTGAISEFLKVGQG
jgi:predicted phosphoserine aminotransferase